MKPEKMSNSFLIAIFSSWLQKIAPVDFPPQLSQSVESVEMFGVELLRRLQEGEKAKKGLLAAAKYLSELTGTCPLDPSLNPFGHHNLWKNCPAEKSPDASGCYDQTEECWLNFLLEQAESGEEKG